MIVFIVFSLFMDFIEVCPDICRCELLLKRVNCRGSKLTQVPKNIPSYVNMMTLNRNNLKRIEPGDFDGLPNLTRVYLRDTKLEVISVEVLKSLRNLTVLSLKDCLLQKLPIFPQGMQLRALNVDGNLLKSIANKTFANLEHLVTLTINNNQISNIHEDSFMDLNKLKKLYLNNNFLRLIPDNLFVDLKNLEVLNLADNNLFYLQSMVFKGLKKLQHLVLEKNDLVEMDKNSLKSLKSIKVINIIQNKLKYFHPDLLQSISKDGFLYLYGNLIPCTCAYFRLLRRAPQRNIYADCLLFNSDENIERWLDLTTNESTISSGMQHLWGMRHCRDCSKKRFPTFCSFNATGSNFTCVFIQDNRNDVIRVWTQNPLIENCTNMEDKSLDHEDKFPVIVVAVGIAINWVFCNNCRIHFISIYSKFERGKY